MRNDFLAYPGLQVTMLGRRTAEQHDRRSHNVPAHVGLGWRPYTIRVMSPGALSYTAYHSVREFKAWLRRSGCWVRLLPHRQRGRTEYVIRLGYVVRDECGHLAKLGDKPVALAPSATPGTARLIHDRRRARAPHGAPRRIAGERTSRRVPVTQGTEAHRLSDRA